MSVYQRASVSQIIRVIIYDIPQLDNHDNDNTSSISSERYGPYMCSHAHSTLVFTLQHSSCIAGCSFQKNDYDRH